ncbi:hypothetical protein COI_0895 [Mannheimia haemolytica serotype A2 str. OVINE]|nr:hypothetical protein COI_0895 [Mannheimia haemolytica serotype A2 str. OVINE]EEY11638.1 hypothetical protein COK_2247 [Mannheimia haemolytica serotype A2 str. BOVINE]
MVSFIFLFIVGASPVLARKLSLVFRRAQDPPLHIAYHTETHAKGKTKAD